MNKLYMIHDFIGWAFYNDVNGKDIKLVSICYHLYCSTFGIDEVLENKDLQALICKEYDCYINNGVYMERG